MKKTELAWAAGFFDGEGTTTSYACPACKGYKRNMLAVSQKYRPLLDRFRKAVGKIGKVYGPYGKPSHVFSYEVKRQRDIDQVLTNLWPYLGQRKRTQAKKAGFRLGHIRNPNSWLSVQEGKKWS